MEQKRLNNIELLRILSMVFVLVLHYLNFGGLLSSHTTLTCNALIIWFVESLTYIAVNCYVLISGYFLINSKFKKEKVFKLVLEVLFYSIIIFIIMLIFGKTSFSFTSLIKNFFPIIFGNYWFITCYIVLYVLSPFLNKFIFSLSKENYKKLIILIVSMFSIWATFINNANTINFGGSYSISWFIFNSRIFEIAF